MNQQLRMKTGIRLSPELRLSLRVLSMNLCELEQYIEEAQAENPALEMDHSTGTGSLSTNFTEECENWVDTLPQSTSLKAHLAWQIETGGFSDFEKAIAGRFLDEMDDDGFLREQETKRLDEVSVEIRRTRRKLRQLDPIGAFSFDMREALLAQLEDLGYAPDSLEGQMIHMSCNPKIGKLSKIQSKMRLSEPRMRRALEVIRGLEPIPGRRFRGEGGHGLAIPEIKIVEEEGELKINLLDEARLKVHLSEGYFSKLKQVSDIKTRPYVNMKFREAKWLQNAVQHRGQTLVRVAQAILERQKGWFLGKLPLVPLTLREIAVDVGLHESTISRVTNGKFVETFRGTFELKYFFSSPIGSTTSKRAFTSSRYAKEIIEASIKKENKHFPLTDGALQELLLGAGIKAARRTVAKYREQLGLAKSSARRSLQW